MPPASSIQLQPPTNWQDFERLCCELWKRVWDYPHAQMNGRNGQTQHGVDIFGRPAPDRNWAGIQCKGKDNYAAQVLTESEVKGEVAKAEQFSPALSQFTIATTGQKDTAIEQVARTITADHQAAGKFSVNIYGWDDIRLLLNSHDDLAERFCNVQSSATRIVQSLRPLFDEISERITSMVRSSTLQQAAAAFGIRRTFDDGTSYGREMQFQYDGFLAVARSLRIAYPEATISELPWPNDILRVELASGISLRVHVHSRFLTNVIDIDGMVRFIEHSRSESVLTQELLVFVTGDSSFAHLRDYFQRIPRTGTAVAIATLNSNTTIKDWLYLP